MRIFLYGIATFCGFLALALLLYPILSNLQSLSGGLGAFITLTLTAQFAPLAIGLAVIPLCIAFAYDRMSEY